MLVPSVYGAQPVKQETFDIEDNIPQLNPPRFA
jgi:hypothetical protein